jgi:hypothetical protein
LTEIRLSERSAAMRERGKGIGVAVAEFKTEEKSPKARKQTACKAKHRVGVKIYITRRGHKDIKCWRGQRLARVINIEKEEAGERRGGQEKESVTEECKYCCLINILACLCFFAQNARYKYTCHTQLACPMSQPIINNNGIHNQ